MPRLSKIGAAALAAFGWTSGSAAVTVSYLVVAGGAGGGADCGGGGGAGGLLSGTASLNPTLSYTVTVGAGGVGAATSGLAGSNGSNSSLAALAISVGGGGGGGRNTSNAATGGSGGGGSGVNGNPGAAGTSGQGNAGGAGYSAVGAGGGGGGGSSAVGTAATSPNGGNGGAGTANSISGSSVTYAGGGGGGEGQGAPTFSGGTGGAGGGGNGASTSTAGSIGFAGTANTGGGGGGGGRVAAPGSGGSGGSGVVIISYSGAQQFSGGVVTSSGGNTIHTFTTSGTLGPVTPLSANYLVVAGGAGGGDGRGGGGGAGGVRSYTGLTIDPNSTYLVTVGAGGSGASTTSTKGASGGDSFFSTITSAGGGGGGSEASQNGNTGGSGGGAATNGAGGTQGFGGAGNTPSTSPVQGYAGGDSLGLGANPNNSGAGGGGAGGAGTTVTTQPTGGNGGIGVTSSISGTSTYYGGGGGGGSFSTSYAGGTGGNGGGGTGAGSVQGVTPANGTANLGGGGGGSTASSGGTGGSGGAGVVIISYAGATQLMAGGVVTIAGGNVIHTFNSSGFLTPLTLLTRSLRFRSSASAYLNRTPTTATNQQKFTVSVWYKAGKIGVSEVNANILGAGDGSSLLISGVGAFGATFNDRLIFRDNGGATTLYWPMVFRDPAAWYHIVFAMDTTQATAANRAKLYVNGVDQGAFSGSAPSQNTNTSINSASSHTINSFNGPYYFSDLYYAEYNFIDGQALAPTAFGTVNSYGVWQPITYGGSYGTNGFRLPFTNNASTTTLGYDFSPQGNNWTTNNISLTAGSTYDSMTDVPTLTSATAANFAVMNPLNAAPTAKPADGNLLAAHTSGSLASRVGSTFAVNAGKWYWEATVVAKNNATYPNIGIAPATSMFSNTGSADLTGTSGAKCIRGDGSNEAGTAYGGALTAGMVVGFALDMDAGTIVVYENNVSQGTLASGLSGYYIAASGSYNNSNVQFNFGQRPFTYTPPSGFLALNTFNL